MGDYQNNYHYYTADELLNIPTPLNDLENSKRLYIAVKRMGLENIEGIFSLLNSEGEKNFRRRMKDFYKYSKSLSKKTTVHSPQFFIFFVKTHREALTSKGKKSLNLLSYVYSNFWGAINNQNELQIPQFNAENCEEVLDFFDTHFSEKESDFYYWVALCDSVICFRLDSWFKSERFARVRQKIARITFFNESGPVSSRKEAKPEGEALREYEEKTYNFLNKVYEGENKCDFSLSELEVELCIDHDWMENWLKNRDKETVQESQSSAEVEKVPNPEMEETVPESVIPESQEKEPLSSVLEEKNPASLVDSSNAIESSSPQPSVAEATEEKDNVQGEHEEGNFKIEFPRVSAKEYCEEGTLYTGVLSVVTRGRATYYNFYPKFVWNKEFQPQILSVRDFRYRLPNISIPLRTPSNIRRNYPCLKDGALINVWVTDELTHENGLTEFSNGDGFYLDNLFRENRICLSEEAPEDFRVHHLFREIYSGPDGEIRVEPVHPEQGQVFPHELCVLVKGSYYIYGPLKVHRIGNQSNTYTGNKKTLGAGLLALPDCCLSYKAMVSSATATYSNKIKADESFKSYPVIFTGASLCKTYLEDLGGVDELFKKWEAVAKLPPLDKEELLKQISASVNFPPDSPYRALLEQRRRKIDRLLQIPEKAASSLAEYTNRLINNWSLAISKNPENGKILLEQIAAIPGAMETFFASDSIISAKKEEQKKVTEELEKLLENKERVSSELSLLREEYADGKAKLKQISQGIDNFELLQKLKEEKVQAEKELSEIRKTIQKEKEDFEEFSSTLNRYDERLSQTKAKIAELHLDKVITDMMGEVKTQKTNSSSGTLQEKAEDPVRIKQLNTLCHCMKVFKGSDELVEDLVRNIQQARKYERDEIINLLTCISTGFLTVLAGAPGSGKTTLSDIIGSAFGLTSLSDMDEIKEAWGKDADIANRYLAVAVERGWTSKRDFIGYYNPLTESFECGDEQRYEALRILDMEQRAGMTELPYLILLDEANLSPIEYYFADFINIGERRAGESFIALGDHHRYKIGDNLRFIATLNTDHTTERLSPRMLDRSWIVTLPESRGFKSLSNSSKIPENRAPISWKQFSNAFKPAETFSENNEWWKKLDKIINAMEKINIQVSRRSLLAVLSYISAAEPWLGQNNGAVKAADYAVYQRFLPKIEVYGSFKEEFDNLYSILDGMGLQLSAKALARIIKTGDELKGYSFF